MKGLRVVDMTSVLSGPFCTWLLASMGADVIKVESPQGDSARATGPFQGEMSLYFASLNRGKRSLLLDLKKAEGRQALHRLLATADVFVENMRPGVRDRLGCDDRTLQTINPRLIRASISGFGQRGSLAAQPAYDIVVQAMSGMMSINGALDGPATRVGFSVGDIAAALFATIGILHRLHQRDARAPEDRGRDVRDPVPPAALDISMLACQWACLENAFARHLNNGDRPRPLGSRHPSMTPFESYPTADRDIVVALGSAKDWPRFCRTVGRSDLIEDPRFAEDHARLENREALGKILAEHFRTRASGHWIDRLITGEIPCSLVNNIEDVAKSALAVEYGAFSEVTLPDGKPAAFVRSPFAAADAPAESPAPRLGQDSAAILAELGYEQSEIDLLIQSPSD